MSSGQKVDQEGPKLGLLHLVLKLVEVRSLLAMGLLVQAEMVKRKLASKVALLAAVAVVLLALSAS